MGNTSIDVLIDEMDNGHRVGVGKVLRHVDDRKTAIRRDEVGRRLNHLHVTLKGLQDAQQLGGAAHVHRRGCDEARVAARKIWAPGEDLLGRDEVDRQPAHFLGDLGGDVVVGHSHGGECKAKERAQGRRAVRGRVRRAVEKPRILHRDDAEAFARGRGAAHGRMELR